MLSFIKDCSCVIGTLIEPCKNLLFMNDEVRAGCRKLGHDIIGNIGKEFLVEDYANEFLLQRHAHATKIINYSQAETI